MLWQCNNSQNFQRSSAANSNVSDEFVVLSVSGDKKLIGFFVFVHSSYMCGAIMFAWVLWWVGLARDEWKDKLNSFQAWRYRKQLSGLVSDELDGVEELVALVLQFHSAWIVQEVSVTDGNGLCQCDCPCV